MILADAERLDVSQLLAFMQKHGSSVELNWGEDNAIWEASWITGGERFTGVSSAPRVALRRAIESVLEAPSPEGAMHRYLADYLRQLGMLS